MPCINPCFLQVTLQAVFNLKYEVPYKVPAMIDASQPASRQRVHAEPAHRLVSDPLTAGRLADIDHGQYVVGHFVVQVEDCRDCDLQKTGAAVAMKAF